jgi:hypothetical protein
VSVAPALDWVRSLWPFGRHVIYPERRSGTRYLTLKNAARAAIALVAVFFLLSIWSAHRPAHSGASLGDLRATSPDSPVSREPYPVIEEGATSNYPQVRAIVDNTVPPPASTTRP